MQKVVLLQISLQDQFNFGGYLRLTSSQECVLQVSGQYRLSQLHFSALQLEFSASPHWPCSNEVHASSCYRQPAQAIIGALKGQSRMQAAMQARKARNSG